MLQIAHTFEKMALTEWRSLLQMHSTIRDLVSELLRKQAKTQSDLLALLLCHRAVSHSPVRGLPLLSTPCIQAVLRLDLHKHSQSLTRQRTAQSVVDCCCVQLQLLD